MELINERATSNERSGFMLKARWDWMKVSFVSKVRVAADRRKTIVQVGEEKQGIKTGTVVVGGLAAIGGFWILAAPVAVAGGVARYRSYKVTEGIWEVIEKHMSDVSREIPANYPASQ